MKIFKKYQLFICIEFLILSTDQLYAAYKKPIATGIIAASNIARDTMLSASNSQLQQPTDLSQLASRNRNQDARISLQTDHVGSYNPMPQNRILEKLGTMQGLQDRSIQNRVNNILSVNNRSSDQYSGLYFTLPSSLQLATRQQPVTASSLSYAALPPTLRSLAKKDRTAMPSDQKFSSIIDPDRWNHAIENEQQEHSIDSQDITEDLPMYNAGKDFITSLLPLKQYSIDDAIARQLEEAGFDTQDLEILIHKDITALNKAVIANNLVSTDANKIEYLKKILKDYRKNINYSDFSGTKAITKAIKDRQEYDIVEKYILNMTKDFTGEQFIDFIDTLNQSTTDKDLNYIALYDLNALYRQWKTDNKTWGDNLLEYLSDLYVSTAIKHGLVTNKLAVAYHECGHILLMMLSKHTIFTHATIISKHGSNGTAYVETNPAWRTSKKHTYSWFDYIFDTKVNYYNLFDIEDHKAEIMIYFAGPMAQSMVENGKKLPFLEFLSHGNRYGMGSLDLVGNHDLAKVNRSAQSIYELSTDYQNAHKKYISAIQQDLSDELRQEIIDEYAQIKHAYKFALLEKYYDETWDILTEYQSQLILLASDLYENDVILDIHAYPIVDTKKISL